RETPRRAGSAPGSSEHIGAPRCCWQVVASLSRRPSFPIRFSWALVVVVHTMSEPSWGMSDHTRARWASRERTFPGPTSRR
ncbi:unnamed protein product, partial [Ectocarpus sp. 12 AP-2014]